MRLVSPSDIPAEFRRRPNDVREDLEELCGDRLRRFIDEHKKTLPPRDDETWWFRRAIRWMATYAATRKPNTLAKFTGRDAVWEEFAHFLLLAFAKLVLWCPDWPDHDHESVSGGPPWIEDDSDAVAGTLPHNVFDIHVYCRPAEQVPGDLVDWLCDDHRVWLMFSDAVGHGRGAFLVAQALRCLWKKYAATAAVEPENVLEQVHGLLVDLWPPGVFLQTTLARLESCGRVTLVSAGGSFLFSMDAAQSNVCYEAICGDMLGIDYAHSLECERQVRDLCDGHEVMMATDGLADQFEDQGALLLQLNDCPPTGANQSLFERTERIVSAALKDAEQFDDITFVSIRFKDRPSSDLPGTEKHAPHSQEWQIGEDVALVRRFLAGDREAEHQIHEHLRGVVHRATSRLLGPSRSADWSDVAQVALWRIFEKVHTWQGQCPLRSWAAIVAGRVAVDAIRLQAQMPRSLDFPADVPDRSRPPDPAVVECIERKVDAFRSDWRLAFELRKEGHPNDQIAERLGRSLRTIQLWLQEMYGILVSCLDQ